MTLPNTFSETEHIERYYNEIDLINWKDYEWWKSGKWKNFNPIEDHKRHPIFEPLGVPKKYFIQACKNPYNKYKEAHGNHFVEILEIKYLKKNSYKWLYDNYKLFSNFGPLYFDGTEIIKAIFGNYKLSILNDISFNMQIKPTEPDLFAYKKIDDDKYDMMFIEVKRKDQVSDKQYAGINLIEKYL
jgi:hypothetical protein